MRCHAEHSIAKFWGACNPCKVALDRCIKEEKQIMRKDEYSKGRQMREGIDAVIRQQEEIEERGRRLLEAELGKRGV